MHEKTTNEGFWNQANDGDDQGQGDGGVSPEKPLNPKRAKHQMERNVFPGRNLGSRFGKYMTKKDLNGANFNGRKDSNGEYNMRTMGKDRKDTAMKETVMQNVSPKNIKDWRKESDEVADRRHVVGVSLDGSKKSPTNLLNSHQIYMGPCIADVKKTMQNASGSSKLGRYSGDGMNERLGGTSKHKLCDEDELNEGLLSPPICGQRRKKQLGSVVRSITTELEGNFLGKQIINQDGLGMAVAVEQPCQPQ